MIFPKLNNHDFTFAVFAVVLQQLAWDLKERFYFVSEGVCAIWNLLFSLCSCWIFCVFALQQEAGRYPAYKEMVAEYGWLDKRRFLITKYDFAG